MASFGRSLKPPSYLHLSSLKRRPAAPARSMSSNSPDMSPLSSPGADYRLEDMLLSAGASPGSPQPPPLPPPYGRGRSPRAPSSAAVAPHWRSPGGTHSPSGPIADPFTPTPTGSKPIAIELPPASKPPGATPVYTPPPPAPLSARGDLPGGYFPFHEEQNRVYRPHPFQHDASKARMRSIQRAEEDCSPSSSIPSAADASSTMAGSSMRPPPPPSLNTDDLPRSGATSRTSTPVASYLPSGSQGSPLPMGKYYPSNYERRKDEKRRAHTPQHSSTELPRHDTQVPKTSSPSPTVGHSRNESEVRRRLQQYQRDMIAQASLALNGGNVNAAALSSLRTMGFTSMSNPSKPRLAPLGSPGPVTPMELEDSEDGYLGAHGAANAQVDEIARAIRAEEQRKRREGASSPAVELGPSTF
ncbi:hypothetical protein GGR56DRAFT_471589 [Xylariaceae sp. FL0804]|nr:hypothetical protein GGR56DRAFT_471589 [Xylariaceae sp. FL0804]